MKAFITTDIDEKNLQKLKKYVEEIIYEPWRTTNTIYFDAKSLLPKLNGVDIFICEGDQVGAEVIEKSNLKIIASCRGVPDKVDIEAATKKQIPVLYTPGRNADSVADLTVLLILALARNLTRLDRFLHSDKFEVIEFDDWVKILNDFKGILLQNKVVGIVGFGRIGQAVAKRLEPFGVKMLIYDPYIKESIASKFGKLTTLENLMKSSDIITIHAAQTDETQNLINKDLIDSMKEGVLFINTARASIVDYSALEDAIKSGKVGGAALDVFDIEPLDEDNEFLQYDNVICLPHIGSNTDGVIEIQSKMVVEDIIAILKKKEPKYILNPEVLGITKREEDPELAKLIEDLSIQLIRVCKTLVNEGLIAGSSGNVSVRIPGKELIIITPSTVDYLNMKPEDLVILDFNGNQIKGSRNPSVEKNLHLGIYKKREDVGAIIHSHGPNSIAFSLVRDELPAIVEEFIPYVGGTVKVAEYAEAGSEELAENIIKALEDKNAAIAVMHGNVCCGSHLEGALTVTRLVEHVCGIYLKAAPLGTPRELDEDVIDYEMDMYEIFKESKKV
ncbi:MAG: NAD(P)-dependent oxidoreductase [Promethearchaeota archaeon]